MVRGGSGNAAITSTGLSQVVVLDNGAGTIKLGLAGEQAPRIAKPKGERGVYIGPALNDAPDIMALNIRRPFDRGFLVNWDLEREIWWRGLRTALSYVPASGAGLVLTEPLFNFDSVAAETEEQVFEEFKFDALFVAPASYFAIHEAANCAVTGIQFEGSGAGLVSSACTRARSGLVVDVGFSATTVAPFFDGGLLLPGVRRLNLGGKALTNLLKETVSYRSFNLMEEAFLIESVKDQLAFVSQNTMEDLRLARHGPRSPHRREFVLPDGVHNLRGYVRGCPGDPSLAQSGPVSADALAGTTGGRALQPGMASGVVPAREVHDASGTEYAARSKGGKGGASGDQILVLNNERFMTMEALFRPADIGLSVQAGLAEMIVQSVTACAPELAPLLFGNVVLSGGGACCPGFAQRLRAELRPLVPDDCEMHVLAPQEPDLLAWRGASRFGAAPTFAHMALTRRQYEESGAKATHV